MKKDKNSKGQLTSNMEDYLEAIYELKKESGIARVKDIAAMLNIKSPSVNSAIKTLSSMGFVRHEKYGYISLTPQGEQAAAVVKGKHDILFRFLTEFLMIDPIAAQKEACTIEHAISEETYQKLSEFFRFLEMGINSKRPRMITLFEEYLKTGKRRPCICERGIKKE